MVDREQFPKQIDRLVASRTLHGSESLCKLLRYLAAHAIEHPGTPLKEYQIATEVFGRRPDFDPQSDSTIRVQAGRLRAKVAEYYASEGESDPVVVELPKGSYLLNFRYRTPVPKEELVNHAPVHEPVTVAPQKSYGGMAATLAVLLGLAVVTIGYLLLNGRVKTDTASAATAGPLAPAEFQVFWRKFLSGPEEPWVVFSNAEFVGRPETGMRYYDKQRDANTPPYDHYTGVGEVLSIHELDQVFNSLHRRIRVKRGSLFSLDDAKNNDLIFIGSPSENLTLMEIPSTDDFRFDRVKTGPRAGDLAVINVHPQAGEQPFYLASRAGDPLVEDYAVVGMMPALNPQRTEVILAGTTTFGTQAAVEYVCRQSSVKQLLDRLGTSGGEVKPFEAILHIKVAKGVPVETELVAVRLRNQ
ncbi:hypothetical protein Acid345_1711 [Candidatus Koribacter versatilis Ellin345]|uniref:OmpR/PhoB-type domain-containing protein n=1 Tax=Koribacter versatilis (strain Ellin345) TaxID=204669 RepID=Q1IQY8_KORVE|nr:helix-turn-helix domain-containing protein [Candidatus Koribacter versatilis]ABF40712.1 hypothetical protein Acid345_1711 [Candidatus Koribacter versatilis Ellin345]